MGMRVAVVTLFPEMVMTVARFGVTARAVERGLLGLECWNPRDYALDRHRRVDDRPYGGGPGMVLMYEPLREAISAARGALGGSSRTVHLSPQGRRIEQRDIRDLAQEPGGRSALRTVRGSRRAAARDGSRRGSLARRLRAERGRARRDGSRRRGDSPDSGRAWTR